MGNVVVSGISPQAITVTLGLAALLLLGARWLDRPAAVPLGGRSRARP